MAFGDLLAAADRAALQHLGGPVRYAPLPLNGDPVDVVGIFDNGNVNVGVGEAGVSSTGPQVFLRLSDLPTDPGGEDEPTITVNGTDYKVREAQEDGQGGVLLLLHLV